MVGASMAAGRTQTARFSPRRLLHFILRPAIRLLQWAATWGPRAYEPDVKNGGGGALHVHVHVGVGGLERAKKAGHRQRQEKKGDLNF